MLEEGLLINEELEAPMRPAPLPKPKNLTLLELTPTSCRYPVNDDRPMLFCGHTTEFASSWCAYHKAIVFVPERLPKRDRRH